jgi:hypothetical protein
MISFGLHNRIIAHPGRAFGLAKLLIGSKSSQGMACAAYRHSGALARMAPTTARGLTACGKRRKKLGCRQTSSIFIGLTGSVGPRN